MKPDLEKIAALERKSFISREVIRENRPLLSSAWHYHPEQEICFTQRSSGKRYVGNSISNYKEGDLVMLGQNLPHGFTTNERCDQVVIQFQENFLGDNLLKQSDVKGLNALFERSKMGLEFHGKTKRKAKKIIGRMVKLEGIEKLISLLRLLSLLSKSEEYETICSPAYSASLSVHQLSRMKIVFDFIETNFQQDIRLSDAAAKINLTDSAFYKFIKRHTEKKFTRILNEYRIDHACKKLSNSRMTVSEICFDSGFKNMSYFNRRFKEIMHESPSAFRRRMSPSV